MVTNTFLWYQFTLYSMTHSVNGVQEFVINVKMPYIPKTCYLIYETRI